jgi:uncharacterized protein YjbI with pentapeptide repeats
MKLQLVTNDPSLPISAEALAEALSLHKLWLESKGGGVRLDLTGKNLRGADLSYSDLRSAILDKSNLVGVNFFSSTMQNISIKGADASLSNFTECRMYGANLERTNFSSATLVCADLTFAKLNYCDLKNSNLYNASLRDAHIKEVNLAAAFLYGTKF